MNKELETTLTDKINSLFKEAKTLARKLLESSVTNANKAREIGVFLIELKDASVHGEFLDKFPDRKNRKSDVHVAFEFTSRTAQRYMAIAKKHPQEITDPMIAVAVLRDVMGNVGALQLPNGHDSQIRHAPNNPFQALVTLAGNIQGTFKKWQDEAPMDEWPDELKMQVKDQLEPLVKIYQSL